MYKSTYLVQGNETTNNDRLPTSNPKFIRDILTFKFYLIFSILYLLTLHKNDIFPEISDPLTYTNASLCFHSFFLLIFHVEF